MNETKLGKKQLIVPVMSIAIFLMLIFSAGYAYFSLSASVQTANGNVVLPQRPALTCTKTDGSITIGIGSLIKQQNSTIAGNTSPSLSCSCAGSGNCTFTVNTYVTFPAGTSSLSAANEATIIATANPVAKCGGSNVASKNYANGTLFSCTVAAGSSVTIASTVSFWNLNTVDQSNTVNNKQGKTLVFNLTVPSYSFTA